MRNWVSIAITAVVALAIGYFLRPTTPTPSPVVNIPLSSQRGYATNFEVEMPKFPDYPKPDVEVPVPVADEVTIGAQRPEPLVGNISALPNPGPGRPGGLSGSINPLAPDVPTELPAADLNADEALARRTILQQGGDIAASSDAKDSSGKVGRTLVVEIDASAASGLRSSLRKGLGDRVVLSDGGTIPSSSPTLRKAEEALAEAKKKVEQARIDFLPQAPILRQMEEDYLAQERAMTALRRASGRVRLNVLLRPTLGG